MSKRRKNRRKPNASPATARKESPRARWRKISGVVLFFGLVAAAIGSGLATYKQQYDISHDLSVIGKGVPVVVQIHDPGCSMCNQLRRNADAAADRFDERLLFRIADISTGVGRQLQRRYDVPHVTLLLFDAEGELKNVLTGVKSEQVLHRSFELHVKRHS